MEIATIGIDIGKSSFHIVGLNVRGEIVRRRRCTRQQLMRDLVNLSPCLVGMEACSGAHHLGQRLVTLGHTVRLIPPQFVKPFVKSQKNDLLDAEAIAEAVQRPTMRFVPLKTTDQLDLQAIHRLTQVPGIGPLTATALVAAIGNGAAFTTGRDLAAWLGLVPQQHSTGGKVTLRGITKRGNRYLRCLFIHGARAVCRHHRQRSHRLGRWIASLESRAHPHIVVVALANKLARTAWVVLQREVCYDGRLFMSA